MTSSAITHLLDSPLVWQGRSDALGRAAPETARHIKTGIKALDQRLPGGGWPPNAVVEILHEQHGIGELNLVLPALAALTETARWITFVAPPFVPYAPALESHGIPLTHFLLIHPKPVSDQLWALEQTMRSGTCAAVLAWVKQINTNHIRRLQLAAAAGNCLAFLFRPTSVQGHASPAALRLSLCGSHAQRQINIIKCRGIPGGAITWPGQ